MRFKQSLLDLFMLLVFAGAGIVALMVLVVPILLMMGGDGSSKAMIVTMWLQDITVFFLPALLWCKWWKKENPWKAYQFKKPTPDALIFTVVFALVCVPFGGWTAELMSMISWPEAIQNYVDDQLVMQAQTLYKMLGDGGMFYTINSYLLIGVATGIAEETMFRGAVRKYVAQHLGVHGTAIMVGFIFSLIHFEFYGFIWRWFLGTFYAYLVYYTGSIWCSILAHVTNNCVAVFGMNIDYVWDNTPQTREQWLELAKGQENNLPLWMSVLSAIATIAILWYFWKNRHNFQNN